jgi:hypothetical protein
MRVVGCGEGTRTARGEVTRCASLFPLAFSFFLFLFSIIYGTTWESSWVGLARFHLSLLLSFKNTRTRPEQTLSPSLYYFLSYVVIRNLPSLGFRLPSLFQWRSPPSQPLFVSCAVTCHAACDVLTSRGVRCGEAPVYCIHSTSSSSRF